MKKWTSLLLASAVALIAAEPMTFKTTKDFNQAIFNTREAPKHPETIKETKDGFRFIQPAGKEMYAIGTKRMKIDPNKRYEISLRYRAASVPTSTYFYVGVICYTDKNQVILPWNCLTVNGSETVLAAAAKKGDKILKVKDASKWTGKYNHATFYAKPDFSDLPNYDASPTVMKAEQKDGVWNLTLHSPLTKDYPAGTPVRCQKDGAQHRYIVTPPSPTATLKPEWTTVKRSFKGLAIRDILGSGAHNSQFRPGTKYIGIIIMTSGRKAVDAEIADLKVTELDK